MKTDRLIGIITTIQQKGTVTAPYLAEKFGVSRRTINRDIEDICKAGIPLLTKQGAGGGVFLAPNFTLSSTAFEQKNTDLLSAEVGSYTVFAVFDFSAESRLAAELGPKAYELKKDGIYLGCGFSSQEDALRWLLSFGDKVLVTSPPEMVKKIKSTIKKMKKRYKT